MIRWAKPLRRDKRDENLRCGRFDLGNCPAVRAAQDLILERGDASPWRPGTPENREYQRAQELHAEDPRAASVFVAACLARYIEDTLDFPNDPTPADDHDRPF